MSTKLVSTGVQFPDSTIQTDVAGSGGVTSFMSDSGSNGSFAAGVPLIINSSGKVEKVTSTTSGFVGFANASGTQGNVLKVTTRGGINSNQSGLTSGTVYYVTSSGTLSTGTGLEVGIALSSTVLYLNK